MRLLPATPAEGGVSEKRNESFLLRRGETAELLEQQLLQVQRVLGQRGSATLGTIIDGLNALCAQARAGDVGARGALLQFRSALREMESLLSIAMPGDS
jgi:hypothetical protein